MRQIMNYRGCDGSVLYDAEDQFFHGKILGIRHMYIYGGPDLVTLECHFRETVEEYLKDEEGRAA